jgi:CDP-glucose 4,6-dehydratase
MIIKKQFLDIKYSGAYNVGPNDNDCIRTGDLVTTFCNYWGTKASWESRPYEGPHEAIFLKLDSSKIQSLIGWRPLWNIDMAVKKTVEWTKTYLNKGDIYEEMLTQIIDYEKLLFDEGSIK